MSAQSNAFVRGYTQAAIILLNVAVAFLVVNVAFGVYYARADRTPKPNELVRTFGMPTLQAAYPGESVQTITELLDESWSRPHAYRPVTQFMEPPFAGKHVNVHEAGFRWSEPQAPWPPDTNAYNVFFFGGSTAFGYGVRDSETVASYLQPLLGDALGREVHVYNFGVSFYYSTLERALLQELLLAGHVPDAAIFLQGLNEFQHERPFYTPFIERWWREHQEQPVDLAGFRKWIPLLRAAGEQRDAQRSAAAHAAGAVESHTPEQIAENSEAAVRRYLDNKRQIEAIAAAHDVDTVFVWQPIPTYKYDLRQHLFAKHGFQGDLHPAEGYAAMAKHVATQPLGDHFLWLADMQAALARSLYVDRLHYSAELSRRIASEIAQLVESRGLLRESAQPELQSSRQLGASAAGAGSAGPSSPSPPH